MRHLFARLLFVFACALSAYSTSASAQRACDDNVCYDSLAEAEAAMRAQSPAGPLFRRKSSYISQIVGDLVRTTITYDVPRQTPRVIYGAAYFMGGHGAVESGCQPSESNSQGCASEQELIDYWRGLLLKDGQCTLRNVQITGAYATPFYQSSGVYTGRSGNPGGLYFNDERDGVNNYKYWQYDISCTNWADQTYQTRRLHMNKFVRYECPVGTYAPSGLAAAYAPPGAAASSVVPWPALCSSSDTWRITVDTTQDCPPCEEGISPANGDNHQNEPDFEFAGVDFVRSYHSLGQYMGDQGSGTGWSHPYEERLKFYGTPVGIVTDRGNYERLRTASDGRLRADHSERVLVSLGDGSYRLDDRGQVIKTFASDGRLTSIRYPQSPRNDVELLYDGTRLTRVVDAQGRSLEFVYTGTLLTSIKLPEGRFITYDHDAAGNLVSVDRGDGHLRRYHYGEPGLAGSSSQINHLTGITSESGRRSASFAYNAAGHGTAARPHIGGSPSTGTSLSYPSATQAIKTTANGSRRTYAIATVAGSRRIASVTDGSGTSSAFYRDDGRVDARIATNGTRTEYAYDAIHRTQTARAPRTAFEQRTVVSRDAAGREVRRELHGYEGGAVVLKGLSLTTYDAAGRVAAVCTVDPAVPVAQAYTCGSAANAPVGVRQTRSTYCSSADVDAGTCPRIGLLRSTDGARTDVSDLTEFTYFPHDAAGCDTLPATCAYRKGDLWKVTNAAGQVTEYLRYDGAGRPLSVKDANGVVTDLEYHARGWLAARKLRGANASTESDDRITRIAYWPTGLVQTVTLPDGSATNYHYDDAQQLTAITDNTGGRMGFALDNAGNRWLEETRDAQGNLVRLLTRTHDQLGQVETAYDAYNYATDFTYDASGNTDTVTDARGTVTDNDYDPLDRLSRTLQDVAGIRAETKFAYDAQDNLTSVVDPKGLETRYIYNGLGDLTELRSPDTGVTAYTYDSAGNRRTQTDARGQRATYGYDALNRLTSITYPTPGRDVSYGYDFVPAVCAAGETFARGRLAHIGDATGSTQYCYDRFGHMVRKVQTTAGKTFTTTYAFEANGQLARMTYPSGLQLTYLYNTNGQVHGMIALRPGQSASEWVLGGAYYHPFGPVSEIVYGPSTRRLRRTLNRNYQPGIVQDMSAGGLSLGYEFDEVGDLVALRDGYHTNPPYRRYEHDALGRLLKAKDGATGADLQGYTYDATGNRMSATAGGSTSTYAYPATSHRLDSVGGVGRRYDAAGNTTGIGGASFAYDRDGRMMNAVSATGAAVNYYYNGKGEQVWRAPAAASAQSYFVYDEAGHWVGEYDANGAALREYIWLGDLPVAMLAPATADPTQRQIFHIQPDHLGTPRVVLDPTRNVPVWTWPITGEAFGNSTPNQDPDADGKTFVLNMRFPGQRYDSVTGLTYNYFRDYEAATGRYVQSDPIGLAGGMSTFGYVEGNPLLNSDPLGLVVKRCCRKAQIMAGLVDHCWLSTDTKTAGMGPSPTQCTKPGEGGSDSPFTPVYVQPHSCEPTDRCEVQPDVDEQCVNRELAIGKKLGVFSPWNNCQVFAREVLNKCSTKKRGGFIPPVKRTPL